MVFVVFDVPLGPILFLIALFFEANVNVKHHTRSVVERVVVAEKRQRPAKGDRVYGVLFGLFVMACTTLFSAWLWRQCWKAEFGTRAKRLNDLFCIGLCLISSFGTTALMSFLLYHELK
jgi:hypothetical protein